MRNEVKKTGGNRKYLVGIIRMKENKLQGNNLAIN
jgi:hypothetical protein